jgi:hypothetical protein
MSTEVWLRGPVAGVPALLQPAAHAFIQAREDVEAVAPTVPAEVLWRAHGAATAGFHLLHLAHVIDRLFTYARGEMLSDEQKSAARAESVPHPELDGRALTELVANAVERALHVLRHANPDHLLDERRVGKAGLPSNVLGLWFHAAEHTTRHAGQFITTVKMLNTDGTALAP